MHVGQLWSLAVDHLPYDFYSLRWCDSTEGHKYDASKLGLGDVYDEEGNDKVNSVIHQSPYQYTVGED